MMPFQTVTGLPSPRCSHGEQAAPDRLELPHAGPVQHLLEPVKRLLGIVGGLCQQCDVVCMTLGRVAVR
jgi:hypothetical protein